MVLGITSISNALSCDGFFCKGKGEMGERNERGIETRGTEGGGERDEIERKGEREI